MPSDLYVLTLGPATGGDLSQLRGQAIADAYVRFRRMGGDDVLLDPTVDAEVVERWGQWLLEQLAAEDRIYQRSGEGWRLRSGKPHAESERRLGELSGWTNAALDGQRELLKHVDDPGDTGNELEQSLSKLAAAGWSVDSKKDKGPPTVHFAAGDMPLTTGEDWRTPGSLHPRFAAAVAVLIAPLPADRRDDEPAELAGALATRLPALAVVDASGGAALLDLRTIAKALRDAGGLDLPDGEPLGPVLAHGQFRLRAAKRKASSAGANGAGPADARAEQASATGPSDPGALTAAHGADAIRLALLHAAAPAKRFNGADDVVGYAAAFLAELRDLAGKRLDGTVAGTRIDSADGLRRRLAGWCDIALARTTENYAQLDMHRATRNAIALLARIEDFDARVTEARGDVAGADREAVGVALALLAQLLAPLAPAAADDVWRQAGRDGSPADADWPSPQREPAAA